MLAQIAGDRDGRFRGALAYLVGGLLQGVEMPPGEVHFGAFRGQRSGDAPAEALAAANNDSAPILKSEIHMQNFPRE